MVNIFSKFAKAKQQQFKRAREIQRAEKEADRLAFAHARSEARQLRRENISAQIKKEEGQDNRLKTRFAQYREEQRKKRESQNNGLKTQFTQYRKKQKKKVLKLNKKEVREPKGVLASGQSGGVFGNMQTRNIHEGVGRNIWDD